MSAELLTFRITPSGDAAAHEEEVEDVLDLPAIMSPGTLAKALDVTTRTLERWRDPKQAGLGPKFIQVPGSNLIRYLRPDVLAWIRRCEEEAGA